MTTQSLSERKLYLADLTYVNSMTTELLVTIREIKEDQRGGKPRGKSSKN